MPIKELPDIRRTINIPKDWKKKPVELFLECTRPTWVYVDGELVDSCNFISTPQRYLLPKKVKPGKHTPGNRGGVMERCA